ncbi:hypothetical protein Hte_012113 [Hypoxylon texense]
MNAHAILTAQGWRGKGHSLHPTSDAHGLTHHLLIKRNDDGSGLGHKKADQKAEAWWLNAFDQALKGIDTKSGTMKQTLKGGALEKITTKGIAKYTGTRGLYSSFVRGGVMEGTVGLNVVSSLPTPPDSGVGTPTAAAASGDEGKEKETKEERRARREAKRLRKAEKQAIKEAKERAAKKVEKKKAKKAERQQVKATETKEERRERRDARRKRKEEKRRMRTKSGG